MKPKILAILPSLIPSTIIGIIKPMLYLDKSKKIDFQMRLTKFCKKADIENADIVVFCRNSMVDDLKFIYWAKQLDKKIIYDIDDNFFEISIESELGKYHRHPVHQYVLEQFIRNATLVRVYSIPMKENVERLNDNFKLTKSYFDFSLLNQKELSEKAKSDVVKIVYATSRGAEDDTAKIYTQVIKDIATKYKDKVEFYIWGQKPLSLKEYSNIHTLKFEGNYDKYISKFQKSQFDIGLAPLVDNRFNRSKTNNKFREYGALEVAGIYSDVDIYTDCIKDGVEGLIVENTYEAWLEALEKLINDETLRNKIITNAYKKVKSEYSMEGNVARWESDIEFVLNQHQKPQFELYNPQYLNTLLVLDCERHVMLSYAMKPIVGALNLLGTNVQLERIESIQKTACTDKDVIIYFLNYYEKESYDLDRLRSFGKKIIVNIYMFDDEQDVINLCNQYKDIQFIINKKCEHITQQCTNLTVINSDDDVVYSDQIDDMLYRMAKINEDINIYSEREDLIAIIERYIQEEKKTKQQHFYSTKSSMVDWLYILSSIPNQGEKKKIILPIFIQRPINKVKLSLRKIYKLIIKIWKWIEGQFTKITRMIGYLIVNFKINYLKKY